MQTHYTFSNLFHIMNSLSQSWYLRVVLYWLLVLAIAILATLLLHPLASAALLAEGCNPNCAPLAV